VDDKRGGNAMKIHYESKQEKYAPLCGANTLGNTTSKRPKVTCKRCLKMLESCGTEQTIIGWWRAGGWRKKFLIVFGLVVLSLVARVCV